MERCETIWTKDGREMELCLYQPAIENQQVIVIGQHVTMERKEYGQLAGYLSEKGYVVITFSYRGIGNSESVVKEGRKSTMKHWATQDLNGALLFAKNRFPQMELILLAHGVSGEIAGIAPASSYINRLILVNSALTCSRLRPFHIRLYLWAISLIAPLLIFWYGYFPGKKIGYLSDIPKGVLKEWAGWCSNSNGLFDDFPDNNYCRLKIPLLALSFSGSAYMNTRAISTLLARYENAQIQWYHLSPALFGQQRLSMNDFFTATTGETLWDVVDSWLQSRENYVGYFNQQDKFSPLTKI